MSTLDLVIIALYFSGMLAVGIFHSRRAASSIRSYFLGENRGKWWMLAASGAAANFDVAGTMLSLDDIPSVPDGMET
jgi:solute:Na+ symporter, SSS family